MITGIAFLLILLAVAVQGGDLRKLASVRPRRPWLVFLAIWLQIGVFTIFGASIPFVVATVLHVASYAFAIAFVWVNRRISGIVLLVSGGLLNLLAIVANGGVMPATQAALEFSGKAVHSTSFENSGVQEEPKLQFLGDVFAFPHGMPFANVFSLGDIVLVIGGYVLVSRACRPGAKGAQPAAVAVQLPQPEALAAPVPVPTPAPVPTLAPVVRSRPPVNATNVADLVRAALEVTEPLADLAAVEVRQSGTASDVVNIDPDHLHHIIVELISDAVMSSRRQGVVAVVHQMIDEALLVSVSHSGAATRSVAALASVRRTVSALGGDLDVQPSASGGCIARLALPSRAGRETVAPPAVDVPVAS